MSAVKHNRIRRSKNSNNTNILWYFMIKCDKMNESATILGIWLKDPHTFSPILCKFFFFDSSHYSKYPKALSSFLTHLFLKKWMMEGGLGPFSITLCESNQQLFSPEMPKYIRSLDENRKHQISPLSLPPSLPVSLCICWPCFRGAESLTSLPQLSWNKTVACTCTSQVGTKINTIRRWFS